MKIEANLLLIRLRLNRKTRDYISKIITLAEQYFVKLKISSTFLKSKSELDIKLNLYNKFWD